MNADKKKLSALIEILRPNQWYKNLVIFLGILFSQNLFVADMLIKTIFAFVLASMLSSANYIINDIVDLEKDKQHPTKKKRPLPSGRITKREAIIYAILLLGVAIYFSFQLNYLFGIGALAFILMGLLYTFSFRKMFLADVIAIAVIFVLRAILGTVAIGVYLSPWLILCTFLLALFLAVGKRKGELILLGRKAIKHREVLKYYNSPLADAFLTFSMTALLISYYIYCTTTKANNFAMIATIPFATFILFKYTYFIFSGNKISTNTELIFKDKQMLISIAIFGILVLVGLYGI